MRRLALPCALLCAAAVAFASGCSSDDSSTSGSGTLSIRATIDPDPPQVGQNTLHIELHDADDQPVSGATLAVDPQMPSMGHGSNEAPVVDDLGDGKYSAFPVTFTMPGEWEVTVEASAGGEQGTKVFAYRPE